MINKNKDKTLIFDVGMHKGEDTNYYLKKGFRVIGFEADPDLVKHCKYRFSKEIENRKLTIVEGAIVDLHHGEAVGQTVKFYKNKENTEWGTVNVDYANRNEMLGTHNEIIEVNAIDFTESLMQFGIPYYLKIDIEGLDTICLKSLFNFVQKPSYISIEDQKVTFDILLEEINLFEQLGFTKYQAVQQQFIRFHSSPNHSMEGISIAYRFQQGSSGPFGEDLPGKWKDKNQIIEEFKYIYQQYILFGDSSKWNRFGAGRFFLRAIARIFRRPMPGWYDIHAKSRSVLP